MAKLRTLEEYDIRIQDYEEFNKILGKIHFGLTNIKDEFEKNQNIIEILKYEQKQLLNDMQNSQLTDRED